MQLNIFKKKGMRDMIGRNLCKLEAIEFNKLSPQSLLSFAFYDIKNNETNAK